MTPEERMDHLRRYAVNVGLIVDVIDDGEVRGSHVWKATIMEAP